MVKWIKIVAVAILALLIVIKAYLALAWHFAVKDAFSHAPISQLVSYSGTSTSLIDNRVTIVALQVKYNGMVLAIDTIDFTVADKWSLLAPGALMEKSRVPDYLQVAVSGMHLPLYGAEGDLLQQSLHRMQLSLPVCEAAPLSIEDLRAIGMDELMSSIQVTWQTSAQQSHIHLRQSLDNLFTFGYSATLSDFDPKAAELMNPARIKFAAAKLELHDQGLLSLLGDSCKTDHTDIAAQMAEHYQAAITGMGYAVNAAAVNGFFLQLFQQHPVAVEVSSLSDGLSLGEMSVFDQAALPELLQITLHGSAELLPELEWRWTASADAQVKSLALDEMLNPEAAVVKEQLNERHQESIKDYRMVRKAELRDYLNRQARIRTTLGRELEGKIERLLENKLYLLYRVNNGFASMPVMLDQIEKVEVLY